MEGASRAAWTRRGLRLPGPWVSHVRFSQAAIPGSPAAFLGGGMGRGWSADSGPGSLAASPCPAVDWLAVCPRAGYTPRSLSFLNL